MEEFALSQLGDGADAVDDDASQALPGGDEALLSVSQPFWTMALNREPSSAAHMACSMEQWQSFSWRWRMAARFTWAELAVLQALVVVLPVRYAAPFSRLLPRTAFLGTTDGSSLTVTMGSDWFRSSNKAFRLLSMALSSCMTISPSCSGMVMCSASAAHEPTHAKAKSHRNEARKSKA